MSARPSPDTKVRVYEVAILGNDMLLAALPGRPVQLAHAILAAGFDLVIPVSWGEEVLAEHALRVLEQPGQQPLVFCACPQVRRRLLASGNEIVPNLLSTVAPPVATARYLRALQPDADVRITYLGSCEGARDPAIDEQVFPVDFLRRLEQQGIVVTRQPSVFESTVPPDRRRHWSMPGGAPSPEALRERGSPARLLVIEGRDVASEIAEFILAREHALLDLATTMGCACAGASEVHHVRATRESIATLEPPRSPLPVVDPVEGITLDHPIPLLAASRKGTTIAVAPLVGTGEASVATIHRPARFRTDRKPIAVTPPGIGSIPLPTPRVDTPPKGASDRLPEPSPMTTTRHEPVPQAAVEPGARSAVHATPKPGPAARANEEAHMKPARAETVEERASNPAQGPEPPHARRRTPAHEMHHIARAAAQGRGPAAGRIPRAYSAVRSRTRPEGVVAVGAPAVEVTPVEAPRIEVAPMEAPAVQAGSPAPTRPFSPERPAEALLVGAGSPAPVQNPSPAQPEAKPAVPAVRGLIKEPTVGEVTPLETASPIATVLEPASGARRRHDPGADDVLRAAPHLTRARTRPLPPPDQASPRKLWGLLASALLVAAIAILLFVIFS